MAIVARETKKIPIGWGIISPYTRNPVQIAMEARVLQDVAGPGRFFLGLGASKIFMKEVGEGEAGKSAGPAATPLSRPLCPYPQTARYVGTGDIHDAVNWVCGGNLETPQVVCPDVVVGFKHEVNGRLDFRGSGVRPAECHPREQPEDDRDDAE